MPPLLLAVWSTDLRDVSERSGLGPPTWASASRSQAPHRGSPGAGSLSPRYRCWSPGVGHGISGLVSDCQVEFSGPGPFCRAHWVVLLFNQGDSHPTYTGGPGKSLVASFCAVSGLSEALGQGGQSVRPREDRSAVLLGFVPWRVPRVRDTLLTSRKAVCGGGGTAAASLSTVTREGTPRWSSRGPCPEVPPGCGPLP